MREMGRDRPTDRQTNIGMGSERQRQGVERQDRKTQIKT